MTLIEALTETRLAPPGWWRRMFPYDVAYCPWCMCNKSNDIASPNALTDACDDEACICHTEEADA